MNSTRRHPLFFCWFERNWRSQFLALTFALSTAVTTNVFAQSPEEIGAVIGSFLRATFVLEAATRECEDFGLETHDSSSDLRDVKASKWGAAFTPEAQGRIRAEAVKTAQNMKTVTAGKSRDFHCGFYVGSAAQGHLIRSVAWTRFKNAAGSKN